MPQQTAWEKTWGASKHGFDKVWQSFDKLGAPVNRLSYRVGAEAFWPMSLGKESDKAARILRSFCKEGFYGDAADEERDTDMDGKISKPKGKQRVLQKIPQKVIQQAKGLAIFTTMRTGLWLSGSGGSGVLIGRIPETGEWSPPSGILLHTAGFGFLAGADIYDCVVVINTYEALNAFKSWRCTLGGEISASAGPVGVGGVLESEVHKRQAPIWTYMKSRGLYGGVQVDGTVIIERTDENERFFGERISVTEILAGKIRHPPFETRMLMQTLKAAQGDMDVDESLVAPAGQTPGDLEVSPPHSGIFGIPDEDDPDPYGVKALEAEGLFIREAGTNARPAIEAFEFNPSETSPIYAQRRLTGSTRTTRNSWRTSTHSYVSNDRGTQTSEAAPTAPTTVSRASSVTNRDIGDQFEPVSWDAEYYRWAAAPSNQFLHDPVKDLVRPMDDDDDDSELEVHEVSSATVSKRGSIANPAAEEPSAAYPTELKRLSPSFTRARLVTIPKRPTPPPLPPRNPGRPRNTSSPAPVSTASSTSPVPRHRRSVTSSNSPTTKEVFSEVPFSEVDLDESRSAVNDSAVDTSYDEGLGESRGHSAEGDIHRGDDTDAQPEEKGDLPSAEREDILAPEKEDTPLPEPSEVKSAEKEDIHSGEKADSPSLEASHIPLTDKEDTPSAEKAENGGIHLSENEDAHTADKEDRESAKDEFHSATSTSNRGSEEGNRNQVSDLKPDNPAGENKDDATNESEAERVKTPVQT